MAKLSKRQKFLRESSSSSGRRWQFNKEQLDQIESMYGTGVRKLIEVPETTQPEVIEVPETTQPEVARIIPLPVVIPEPDPEPTYVPPPSPTRSSGDGGSSGGY